MMEAISRPLHMSESDNREALRKSLIPGDGVFMSSALPEMPDRSEGNRHERRRAAKLERKQRVTT